MHHLPHNTGTRLAECTTLLAKLSADLVELTTDFLTQTTKLNEEAASRPESVPSPVPRVAPAAEHRRKPASKIEVLASVKVGREVIGQQNQPVQVSALYKEVSARGFAINTPRPSLTYSARLRDYRKPVGLIYLKNFGWWLSERPYAPAHYVPTNITRIGKIL